GLHDPHGDPPGRVSAGRNLRLADVAVDGTGFGHRYRGAAVDRGCRGQRTPHREPRTASRQTVPPEPAATNLLTPRLRRPGDCRTVPTRSAAAHGRCAAPVRETLRSHREPRRAVRPRDGGSTAPDLPSRACRRSRAGRTPGCCPCPAASSGCP